MENNFIDTSFYKELGNISHFRLHPELIPYVGAQYKVSRLLLVGESHYIDCNGAALPPSILDDWNNRCTDEVFRNCGVDQKKYIDWFDTRGVVLNFIFHYRSRAHTMFSNPAKVICRVVGTEKIPTYSAAINCTAFMNYYQRPSLFYGKTINVTDEDKDCAKRTFYEVVKVIAPQLIVFCSRKAFNDFGESEVVVGNIRIPVKCTDHPTCPHWNSRGESFFQQIITEHVPMADVKPMQDEQVWLLKEIFNEFYMQLGVRNILFFKCSDDFISDFYKKNTKPQITLENGAKIEIDSRPYVKYEDGSWDYLPLGGHCQMGIPNFRTNKEDYRKLFEAQGRNIFVNKSIDLITSKC